MLQSTEAQHAADAAQHAAAAPGKFNAGETIIGHVANSSLDHPLIHLPKVLGDRLLRHQARADALDRGGDHLRRGDLAGAPLPAARARAAGADRSDERARSGGRIHPRRHRAAQRRQEVGADLDAAAAHALRVHPRRQRHRPDSDLRRPRAAAAHRAPPAGGLVPRRAHCTAARPRPATST